MQVQVNTDHNIEGGEKLARWIETEINDALARFSDQITRIEVHLSDDNAGTSGSNDKRCLIEARLAGRRPEAVSHHGSTLDEAFRGAEKKLKNFLESVVGRLEDQKGSASIRTDKTS
jgi:hypothetical protein